MKRQIRKSVFETNSSSTHSVSIARKQDAVYTGLTVDNDDNKIHMIFGEFGWEYNVYETAYHKLQYALTMVAQTELHPPLDFYETEGFIAINTLIKETFNCDGVVIDDEIKLEKYGDSYYYDFDGYIDHQSYEDYHGLQDFLNDYGITLEDFIFNPGIELITDNDNHYWDEEE